jgi:two-component system OmpR family sensor kinase
MSISIRWRLAAGIVLAFVATLVVIFITVQFALERILSDDLEDDLANNARRVQAEAFLRPIDSAEFQNMIEDFALRAEGQTPFITVIRDPGGELLLSSGGVQPEYMALTEAEYERALAGETVSKTLDLPGNVTGGDEYRVRTQRLIVGGEVAGVVQVAQVTEGVTGPVNTLLVILIAEGIAATVLAIALAFWLARGAVRPLEKVIDVAADIQAHDLRTRINATKEPAEVQKLADTFDAMLERLEKAFREQEDFVLDVSHELRTPLTVLRGSIDVLLMDADLDAEVRERLEQMSTEIARMIRLTGNLLYMASADAGREPEHQPVELDIVCLDVLQQGRALRNEVKVVMGLEDQVSVSGDRDQIKQMVLNLVENAVKYSPAGGEVTLSVYKNGSFAEVKVEDTGPGIPPEILPHIFERFYRGDNRSLMGGTGLGLAIASRIARAHGGDIEAASEMGEGTTFVVKLPLP